MVSHRGALGAPDWNRALLLSATVLSGWAAPALAQEQADTGGLRDIVVTARRVEERLQDVPLSITALDATALANNQITQVQDLAGQVPSMVVSKTTVPGGGNIAIRGVAGAGLPRIGLDNRVGVYLDGVYLARAQGQSFALADIERIEVLKGPQGTLFGRNVTAGSINIITAPPTGVLGAQLEAGVGSRGRQRYRATLNLPEFNGFSARITYVHDETSGEIRNRLAGNRLGPVAINIPAQAATPNSLASPAFTYNINPKPARKWYGQSNSESIFVAARYEGIDNLTADYKFDYADSLENIPSILLGWHPGFGNGCISAAVAFGANTNQCATGIFFGTFPFGAQGVVSTPGTISPRDGYFVSTGAQQFTFGTSRPASMFGEMSYGAYVRTYGHNLTLNYDATDNLHLRSITAYRHLKTGLQGDQDGGSYTLNNSYLTSQSATLYPTSLYPAGGVTGFALGEAITRQVQHQFSQELQAYGPITEAIDFLAGLYYFKEKGSSFQNTVNTNASTGTGLRNAVLGTAGVPPYAPGGAVNNWGIGSMVAGDLVDVTSRSAAVFGRVTVKPIENLDIVVGARYTSDRKTSDLAPFQANLLDFDLNTPGRQQVPTFLKQNFHKFTYDGTITYHVTRDVNVYGRYATAFLSGGALRNVPFLPETTKAAEVGLKSELFNRRLRFNTAAFWQKTYDAQYNVVTGVSVVLPGQTTASTVTATQIQNLGSVRSRGGEFELTAVPMEGVLLSAGGSYLDIKYVAPAAIVPTRQQAPKYQLNLAAEYKTPPLFGDATLSIRADANYRSRYDNTQNRSIRSQLTCSPGFSDPLNPAIPQSGNGCARLPAELLAAYGLPNTAAGVNAYAALMDKEARLGSFWVANLRVSIDDIALMGTTARISAYARNIFDEREGKVFAGNFGTSLMGIFTERRSFGVDLGVKF